MYQHLQLSPGSAGGQILRPTLMTVVVRSMVVKI